ncbi:MAG: hypothetical protein PWR20_2323 [Bacteroidales bacterium]|jgi:predicted nucleic acid-binding Zn ribbon protein|nr:hypothetical protein [Bacteroidales bacterium]MDN5330680.1 hypothetical protein [Bacteroidales bacterium]
MENQRFCLECGEPLTGRRDKKFCGDQCRNNYNNRRYSESSVIIRKVNNILKKNYQILCELNPGGKTTIGRQKLVEKGYNFEYFTSQYITREGKTYHFVYDRGLLNLENDLIMMVVKDTHKGKSG